MDVKEASNKKIRTAIIMISLILLGITAIFFFGCIHDCAEYDAGRLELVHEVLTFEKYEQGHSRSGWYYLIYFKEYEEPFYINSVTRKGVSRSNLSRLEEYDVLNVTFRQDLDEICEISCDGIPILSLSDYVKVNQNNQITGMIASVLAVLCILFMAWMFLRTIEPNNANDGLGKIRIEYVIKGNVIRVYHSVHECSLVINDQIFDQHHGIYGNFYCLKGIIGKMKTGGMTIRVEAKMGLLHMRLYCNGKLVAKKFMAFG